MAHWHTSVSMGDTFSSLLRI